MPEMTDEFYQKEWNGPGLGGCILCA